MAVFEIAEFADREASCQIHVRNTGVPVVVALRSGALSSAGSGCPLSHYPDEEAAFFAGAPY